MRLDHAACQAAGGGFAGLVEHATCAWDRALALGTEHGFRNAQATVIDPTGTIGLVMDCDTTGVEPDFALVKFKKLAGGGYFKIINASIPTALERLGYTPRQIEDIVRYCRGTGTLQGCPHVAGDVSPRFHQAAQRPLSIGRARIEEDAVARAQSVHPLPD